MSLNQFGNFRFVAFHRPEDRGAPPVLCTEETEIIQRPGIDGTGVIRLGRKGVAFQMRSVVDAPSFDGAVWLADQYRRSRGLGPYGIIWGGVNFAANYGTVYVPLDVQIIKCRRIGAAVGGLFAPSLGLVEAVWTMIPIELPTAT